MSYSICYLCKKMVHYYDKYCQDCQKKHGLPNLPEFQKGKEWPDDKERMHHVLTDIKFT